MKKILFVLALILSSVMTFAQGHLEDVIVDKVTDPSLPGQTAYRVFVDLADGWQVSAVYGETGNPLTVNTTTTFYNFPGGAYAGRSASTAQFNSASGRLDSYVTIASFTSSRVGVRVVEDPDGNDGYTNQSSNDALAYTPGMETLLETAFGDVTGTNSLSTSDGAWADQTGYGTTLFGNRVLIAQFTTDGTLTYQLNVQIRDEVSGAVEKYTATPSTPTEFNEFQYAKLTYTSLVAAPIVTWNTPAEATYAIGTLLNLSVDAVDAGGSVTGVAFFRNSVSPANEITSPAVVRSGNTFTITGWPAAQGTNQIIAVATDNESNTGQASRAIVVPSADAYTFKHVKDTCYQSEIFCMPIYTRVPVDNVNGYDMILGFDGTKVQPTGVVYVSNDLLETTPNLTNQHVSVFVSQGVNQMNISLAFKGTAPANAEFQGNVADKQLICVEFARAGLGAEETTTFSMIEMIESRVTGPSFVTVTPESFESVVDKDFSGVLKFWKDNAPIVNNGPLANLGVQIYPAKNMVERLTPTMNNAQGEFSISTGTSGEQRYLKIVRQIEAGNSVQLIINGADAQLVAKMIVDDRGFRPNIYQMFAMDVNRDSVITAGDLSQIMLRTAYASQYPEFKQTDNYNTNGTKKSGTGLSKDWLFIKRDSLTRPSHRISTSFPQSDNVGYSRRWMPTADTVHLIQIDGTDCMIVKDESFFGIMLGDVDGSYASAPTSPQLKSTAGNRLVFDLARAVKSEGSIEIPVFLNAEEEVTSVDFAMQFNEEKLNFGSIIKNTYGIESADHFNTDDRTLRFTGYSLKNIETGNKFATVRFNTRSANVKASDLLAVSALINGKIADVAVMDVDQMTEVSVDFYPNPANDMLNIAVSADAKIAIMDITGKTVLIRDDVQANMKKEIKVSELRNGMYLLKVYNDSFVSNSKVIIQR